MLGNLYFCQHNVFINFLSQVQILHSDLVYNSLRLSEDKKETCNNDHNSDLHDVCFHCHSNLFNGRV